eukprot:gene29561-5911_t
MELQGQSEAHLRLAAQNGHLAVTIQDQAKSVADCNAELRTAKELRIALIVILSLLGAALLGYLTWVLITWFHRRSASLSAGEELLTAEAEVIGATSVMVQVHPHHRVSRGGEATHRLSRGGEATVPTHRASRGGGGEALPPALPNPARLGSQGGEAPIGSLSRRASVPRRRGQPGAATATITATLPSAH